MAPDFILINVMLICAIAFNTVITDRELGIAPGPQFPVNLIGNVIWNEVSELFKTFSPKLIV